MFNRILVAVDGTPPSNAGLQAAIELAKDQDATLLALYVIDDTLPAVGFDGNGFPPAYFDMYFESMQEIGRKILDKAVSAGRAAGVNVEPLAVRSRVHPVAEVVLSQVRKLKADVIVLGTHGRRGLTRALMGSDAEAVVREATVPVLLVRGARRRARKAVGAATNAPARARPPATGAQAGH